MEYDKWDPNAGLIIENEFTDTLKKDGIDAALKIYESSHAGNGSKPPFYEGDMLDQGLAALEKGRNEDAIKILELNLKAHPDSPSTHHALGEAYSRAGKKDLAANYYKIYLEARQGNLEVVDKIGLPEALKVFGKLKKEKRLSERDVNLLGYQLLNANRIQEAITVLQFNVSAFLQSGNVYDSLGEAYLKAGDKAKAIENYRKSLKVDPKNDNAVAMLRKLEKKS